MKKNWGKTSGMEEMSCMEPWQRGGALAARAILAGVGNGSEVHEIREGEGKDKR